MRILFVVPYLPSLIRVRPYNFLRQLGRRHEVTLLATDSPRALEAAGPLRELCRDIQLVPLRRSNALPGCAGAFLRGEPLWSAYCHSRELEARFQGLLEGGGFDLVHLEHLRATRLASSLPAGMPILYDSVDCISLLLERTLHGSHSPLQRALAALELGRTRAWEARILRRFPGVAVTSRGDRAALLALEPRASVEVVPNGVDLDYFRPLDGERDPATIVFSGKMSYHANATAVLHFARRVLPLVRREMPGVKLRVTGSGPSRAVRALAADPGVEVTGYVPDIRPYVGRATVAVCPVTVRVGIQNKLLEAMAMGVPVASTGAGAEGLDAVPGRDLLVSHSPEEMAGQILGLLADAVSRDRLGTAGRRYVETHHRWDAAALRLEEMYGTIIGAPSASASRIIHQGVA